MDPKFAWTVLRYAAGFIFNGIVIVSLFKTRSDKPIGRYLK